MTTLFLPEGLPAASTLRDEGFSVRTFPKSDATLAATFPANVLRILFLNLMPQKQITELDIARMMAGQPCDVALLPVKISGQVYKTTPQQHIDAFYSDFEEFEHEHFNGLIVTGAPLEHLPFEQVRYWPQLCHIMDWAKHHVKSTLYICWGAQAGMYHLYGVPKYNLPAKKFGIFTHKTFDSSNHLMDGLTPSFPMPNSCHSEVRLADIERTPLKILAGSDADGVGVISSADGREIFVVGHLEYAADTLENEYQRDLAKNLPILPPEHYYLNDNPAQGIDYSWQQVARRFYGNWLLLCKNEPS